MIIGLSETIANLEQVESGLNDLSTVMSLAQGQVHRYLLGLSADYPPIGVTGVLPVRKGILKGSFHTPRPERAGNTIFGVVASNNEYGSIVEAHRGFLARTVRDQERPVNDLFAAYLGRITMNTLIR